MIATVLADVFGVSSASIAQHSPAHAIAVQSGQCSSPSGTCSLRPIRPPILALSRRSLRQCARPAANCGVAASASLAAVTARRWASLDNPGAAAWYGSPQAARPARVSQTQRGPGLSTAASAAPTARQRATTAAARLGVTASRVASWSSCTPYISATNTSAAPLRLGHGTPDWITPQSHHVRAVSPSHAAGAARHGGPVLVPRQLVLHNVPGVSAATRLVTQVLSPRPAEVRWGRRTSSSRQAGRSGDGTWGAAGSLCAPGAEPPHRVAGGRHLWCARQAGL